MGRTAFGWSATLLRRLFPTGSLFITLLSPRREKLKLSRLVLLPWTLFPARLTTGRPSAISCRKPDWPAGLLVDARLPSPPSSDDFTESLLTACACLRGGGGGQRTAAAAAAAERRRRRRRQHKQKKKKKKEETKKREENKIKEQSK